MSATENRPSDEQDPNHAAPWWTGTSVKGGIVLAVLGLAATAWLFLDLPGTPDNLTSSYAGAAKVVAMGLIVGGTLLVARHRARKTTPPDKTDDLG
ncbi:hypothetical protein [Streptosporangium sp. KLBMP 9127]|nr:hypothetical protein [Streptosporangium sp. KLBMP 9127]